MERIVKQLTQLGKTISTMESCTGGSLAGYITNIEGASEVLNFAAVTYSNEYKIKMGVDKNIIDKYTVYSKETAEAMAEAISKFTNSDYGVGITGKLNRVDKRNPYGCDNTVYISIYEKETKKFNTYKIDVTENTRIKNKQLVIDYIINKLLTILQIQEESDEI